MTTTGLGARERCQGGAGAVKGASQFLGAPSEAQTFPWLALVPLSGRRATATSP